MSKKFKLKDPSKMGQNERLQRFSGAQNLLLLLRKLNAISYDSFPSWGVIWNFVTRVLRKLFTKSEVERKRRKHLKTLYKEVSK